MKAITTKFIGATNTKPSRIKASAEGVKPLTVTVESVRGNRLDDPHIAAAKLLCGRQGWSTALASGGTASAGVWVHCFIPQDGEVERLRGALRHIANYFPSGHRVTELANEALATI